MGDALRSLQTRTGAPLSGEAVDALAQRTGEMLNEIAEEQEGEPAQIMRMRARAFLEGGSHAEAAVREGNLYELAR